MTRFLAFLFVLFAVTGPARADDIAATGRGVVRVVTIAVVDGQVVGFGHGSGVAVAPNRVVTNAHVVELAERYPDNVLVGVVPSEGARSYRGRVVAYDAARDLALVEFAGARLPAAALFGGAASEGQPVVALGYPGNVDLATARSAADYISPVTPVRSEGVVSGRRALNRTEVLLHTAPIARGNSGGPLLDRCGRIVGINSAITRGEEGDTAFGFAISEAELVAFLRAAGQPVTVVAGPCVSMEDRLREDAAADARSAAEAAASRREAATAASIAREDALAQAREAAQHARENVMGLAVLLLVAGAMAVGGAGLLAVSGRREAVVWTFAAGLLGMVAGVLVFVERPSVAPTLPVGAAASVAATRAPEGRMLCRIAPERSRITVSAPRDVTLDWRGRGCAGGRRWVEAAGSWQDVAVAEDGAVSLRRYDPTLSRLEELRYLLTTRQAAALEAADAPERCDADVGEVARAQAGIRAALPTLPNEKLSYSCLPAR